MAVNQVGLDVICVFCMHSLNRNRNLEYRPQYLACWGRLRVNRSNLLQSQRIMVRFNYWSANFKLSDIRVTKAT